MSHFGGAPVDQLGRAQARELSRLVDLEACWENLRKPAPRQADDGAATKDLSTRQKAYDAFRSKLVAYNKRYAPAHVPELLLNTPARLGSWCKAMRQVLLQVEDEPQGQCPVHLLEKAHRCAEHISARLNKGPAVRTAPPTTVGEAIRELEALVQWCDDLVRVAEQCPQ